MNEIIQINWLLLAAPFLWILGIGVILALLGLMRFLNASTGMKCRDFLEKPLGRIGLLISAGLIISGFLLNYARIPSHRLIVVKIDKQRLPAPRRVSTEAPLYLSPGELEMDAHNKSHFLNNEKMENNTMVLFWDGYIQTPFIQFQKGDYQVEFQAKGSKAEEEFSRIKVEFEIPDENNYLQTGKVKYFQLTGNMETFRMDFQITTNTIGRIRAAYFNDLFIPETKQGRDVWIKEVKICVIKLF